MSSLVVVLISLGIANGQSKIAVSEAVKHIGDSVSICDTVSSGRFLESSSITLLNMGGIYLNNLLTLIIRGDIRKKFTFKPEEEYQGKTICVTGRVVEYKGKPQINITSPEQLKKAL